MRLFACLLLLTACSDDDASRANDVVCGDGGVTLSREEGAGCNVIRGDLFLRDDITESVAELSSVREVTGFFRIFRSEYLTDLRGLENLQRVGGEVSFAHCTRLNSLRGLEGLKSTGKVTFENNEALTREEMLRFVDGLDSHGPVQLEPTIVGQP